MTVPVPQLRRDLDAIVRAAIDAVHAGRLVRSAFDDPTLRAAVGSAREVDVIAAGKAAATMLEACVEAAPASFRRVMGVGPERRASLPAGAEWFTGGHPLPNGGSVAGATRALEIARAASPGDLTVILLSGGGSALMALPAGSLTLEEKQATARTLMAEGADIYDLNTVRKHLSAIKGGRLAAAAASRVHTLAVSDVVGDDLSVIASGPSIGDASTFADACDVLRRRGGAGIYPAPVVAHLERGRRGEIAETPAPGDDSLARATAAVIGPQRGAIDGARAAAAERGYHVHVVEAPVTGEARVAAVDHIAAVARAIAVLPRPLCVVSSGETTVTVRGAGKGGRNQEFALAMARELHSLGSSVAAASVGTDGIDGPTDAAGAIVDASTLQRAASLALQPLNHYFDTNDTYMFFDRMGDLIRTGPTSTNVGDLQVILIA